MQLSPFLSVDIYKLDAIARNSKGKVYELD